MSPNNTKLKNTGISSNDYSLLTINQTAERVGRNPRTVARWIDSKLLDTVILGGEHFVTENDLAAFIRLHEKYRRAAKPKKQKQKQKKNSPVIRYFRKGY
jgi:hypothetical protein